MSYRLHQFNGVALPLGMAEDDLSTGEVDTSLIDSVGGAYNVWGTSVRVPRKQTISHGGMYTGETTYLVDHAGNHILDHAGNFIIVNTAAAMLRGQIDALKRMTGTQASLTRYREDDAALQWKTARLLGVRHDQTVADVNVAMLRSTFETTMAAWRGATQKSTSVSWPTSLFFTVSNGGDFPVTDTVITITAATAISTITIKTDHNVEFVWTGTLAAASVLVIDCGAQTVLKDGANAYSGFSIGSTHAQSSWMPLDTGDNLVTLDGTGSGTVAITWYDQFA